MNIRSTVSFAGLFHLTNLCIIFIPDDEVEAIQIPTPRYQPERIEDLLKRTKFNRDELKVSWPDELISPDNDGMILQHGIAYISNSIF